MTAQITVRQVQTAGGKTTTLEYGWQGTTPLTPLPGERWDPSEPGVVSGGPIAIANQAFRLRPHEATLDVTVPRGHISQTWRPALEIQDPDDPSTSFVLDTETILRAVKAPATIIAFASGTIFGCAFQSGPVDAALIFF